MIFTRDEISISKAKRTSRKLGNGVYGQVVTAVGVPSRVLQKELYSQLNRNRMHAAVVGDISWSSGASPKRRDAVWYVVGGASESKAQIIGRDMTYANAIEFAIDWVYSANLPGGEEVSHAI